MAGNFSCQYISTTYLTCLYRYMYVGGSTITGSTSCLNCMTLFSFKYTSHLLLTVFTLIMYTFPEVLWTVSCLLYSDCTEWHSWWGLHGVYVLHNRMTRSACYLRTAFWRRINGPQSNELNFGSLLWSPVWQQVMCSSIYIVSMYLRSPWSPQWYWKIACCCEVLHLIAVIAF